MVLNMWTAWKLYHETFIFVWKKVNALNQTQIVVINRDISARPNGFGLEDLHQVRYSEDALPLRNIRWDFIWDFIPDRLKCFKFPIDVACLILLQLVVVYFSKSFISFWIFTFVTNSWYWYVLWKYWSVFFG